MREYFARRYSPANIVLGFAGKADWDQLVDLAERALRTLARRAGARAGRSGPRHRRQFQAILREDDQQQTVVGVCDGPPLESADRYAAHLLATILGDHTGSRLYWTLIDPGLADGAELSYQDYNQAGAFFTFLSCEPEETQANLGRIAEVYRDVMADGVTEDELTQAKNKVLARSVLRSERPMGRLASLGLPLDVPPRLPDGRQRAGGVFKVTLTDLNRVLRDWPLWPMTIVSVGPTTDILPAK